MGCSSLRPQPASRDVRLDASSKQRSPVLQTDHIFSFSSYFQCQEIKQDVEVARMRFVVDV